MRGRDTATAAATTAFANRLYKRQENDDKSCFWQKNVSNCWGFRRALLHTYKQFYLSSFVNFREIEVTLVIERLTLSYHIQRDTAMGKSKMRATHSLPHLWQVNRNGWSKQTLWVSEMFSAIRRRKSQTKIFILSWHPVPRMRKGNYILRFSM